MKLRTKEPVIFKTETIKNKLKKNITLTSAFHAILVFIIFIATHFTADAQLNFAPAVNYPAGPKARAVFSDDFNNDGKLDIVTANDNTNSVSILMGNGMGSFSAPTNYPIPSGSIPISIFSADFNNDGKQDIVTANSNSDNVSVLLGTGTGAFGAAVNYPAGSFPYSVFSADFNNDNKMDLAVANYLSDNVSVLLGTGTGSFSAPVNYQTDTYACSVFSSDFNNDGNMDLVVAAFYGNVLSVFLGNGDGTFATAVNYAVGLQPVSIFCADFNNDGNIDLATLNYSIHYVSILLGNGTGTFGPAINYSACGPVCDPASLFSADFNGDGNLDLVTANLALNNISVLIGNGSGAFGAYTYYPVGISPYSVYSADFNGDGRKDVVTANGNSGNVSVLLNTSVAGNRELKSLSKKLNVYPNPASTEVKISGGEITGYDVSIKTITGTEVYINNLYNSGEIIDVSKLQNGLYFIEAWNKTKQVLLVEKIVITR